MNWSPYLEQQAHWPRSGRQILAASDDTSVVVYQAYRPEIADWAVAHQAFGGPWSFERMSWIKSNFLWMMYRSGWATKPGQERILAVRLAREGFDTILARSVESSPHPEVTGWEHDDWQARGKAADVRLQWDPDHDPVGNKLERRAVQLGMRGATLRSYATEWVLSISDITPRVAERRPLAGPSTWNQLTTPTERVYRPLDPALARQLRLSEEA